MLSSSGIFLRALACNLSLCDIPSYGSTGGPTGSILYHRESEELSAASERSASRSNSHTESYQGSYPGRGLGTSTNSSNSSRPRARRSPVLRTRDS